MKPEHEEGLRSLREKLLSGAEKANKLAEIYEREARRIDLALKGKFSDKEVLALLLDLQRHHQSLGISE